MNSEKESFKCGLEEIVRIAQHGHQDMVRRNAAQDIVLAGLRKNGMLQYRPNTERLQFAYVDLDERFKDMPVGSHRLKDEWLFQRKDWLDNTGRPHKADWNKSEVAKTMEDLVEQDYYHKEKAGQKEYSVKRGGIDIKIPIIDVECDEQSLFSDKAAWESFKQSSAESAVKLRKQLGQLRKRWKETKFRKPLPPCTKIGKNG